MNLCINVINIIIIEEGIYVEYYMIYRQENTELNLRYFIKFYSKNEFE